MLKRAALTVGALVIACGGGGADSSSTDDEQDGLSSAPARGGTGEAESQSGSNEANAAIAESTGDGVERSASNAEGEPVTQNTAASGGSASDGSPSGSGGSSTGGSNGDAGAGGAAGAGGSGGALGNGGAAGAGAQPSDPGPTQCLAAGELNCSDTEACCDGSMCIADGATIVCAALCTDGTQCVSGCCVPLTNGSASVCVGADACIAPPPPPAATYNLTRIDRVASNLYKATSGTTDLVIQTRLCLALTLRDDGLLVEAANGELEIYIDNSSGDVCDVVEVYVADPPLGTFSLTGIEQVGSDIYTAQSGAADLVIETQLCLALPVFDDGILVWESVGSQLYIETFSGDVCDVVNVYSN